MNVSDITPVDTDDNGKKRFERNCSECYLVQVKLATGAELEFLGTSSACSTSTRNVSSLAFHYRNRAYL